MPGRLKDAARTDVIRFLCHAGYPASAAVGVRVNAPTTFCGLKDLTALAECGTCPALVLVPKVEASRDIDIVARIMRDSAAAPQVWALIESPQAVQNLASILRAPALAGVVFGAADYAAQAGCKITSRAMWYPRAMLAGAAAAAGLPAVDSPYFSLLDLDGLRREAEESAELGFAGKVAVHPGQLPVIQEVFRPSLGDLSAAQAVISAADAAGGAITTVDGAMVGPPIVAAARALAARAGQERARAVVKEADHD